MTTSAGSIDATATASAEQAVPEGHLLRHPAKTRIIHWLVALSFTLALLSGLAIYSPWLYHWLTPIFGGGAITRLLHPWFSLAFVLFFTFELFNWRRLMAWAPIDSVWMKGMKDYVRNKEGQELSEVGFFNAGQKLYFWAIAGSALIFLITGLVMWFPEIAGGIFVAIAYVLHDVAGLVMLGGFIVHIYEGTLSQPGTIHSMTRGTVTDAWAWSFHPGWYKEQKRKR